MWKLTPYIQHTVGKRKVKRAEQTARIIPFILSFRVLWISIHWWGTPEAKKKQIFAFKLCEIFTAISVDADLLSAWVKRELF